MIARSRGRPVVYTDTIDNAILFTETSTMLDTTKLIHLLGRHIWRWLLVMWLAAESIHQIVLQLASTGLIGTLNQADQFENTYILWN